MDVAAASMNPPVRPAIPRWQPPDTILPNFLSVSTNVERVSTLLTILAWLAIQIARNASPTAPQTVLSADQTTSCLRVPASRSVC